MKVTQIVKRLNNTELGKGNTHDTYILIPRNLDISDIFPNIGEYIDFIDKETKKIFKIRHTEGREKRIVGLGVYYNEKSLGAGDEIILEKQCNGLKTQYFISYNRRNNVIVFQKSKNDFEILTMSKYKEYQESSLYGEKRIELKYTESRKKRQDSPLTTDYYDILVDKKSLLSSFSGKEIGELIINDDSIIVDHFCTWEKYIFEMEV